MWNGNQIIVIFLWKLLRNILESKVRKTESSLEFNFGFSAKFDDDEVEDKDEKQIEERDSESEDSKDAKLEAVLKEDELEALLKEEVEEDDNLPSE